ncbi:MAG: glycosyltransferase family 2 protein [Lachnospiraceae bacterium]|nr:glycosyltransferase family 2 protein [Lachnospiraceae bacterium]
MSEKIFFVMPAYNEEENIKNVVEQWSRKVDELVGTGVDAWLAIANDGSKDATYATLQELKKEYPRLIPLDKPNSGHGATVMYLYNYAINHGADYIFQTDSDGQTNPDEFDCFWAERAKWDLQIGSRKGRQDGFSRVVVTKVLKGVVRLTFGVSVPDANTPFRLMNVKTTRPVLELIPNDFFLSNVALSAIAVKKGLKNRWMPITFKPRQGGVNSINLRRIIKIGRKALFDFIKINRSLGM